MLPLKVYVATVDNGNHLAGFYPIFVFLEFLDTFYSVELIIAFVYLTFFSVTYFGVIDAVTYRIFYFCLRC